MGDCDNFAAKINLWNEDILIDVFNKISSFFSEDRKGKVGQSEKKDGIWLATLISYLNEEQSQPCGESNSNGVFEIHLKTYKFII